MPPATFASVRSLLRAVVSTIVPEAATLDEQRWGELETLIEHALARRPPSVRRQLRLFLTCLEWAALLRTGRRFTRLGDKDRAHFLAYLESHRVRVLRVGLWGIRSLAFLGYYGREETARAIGYTPDARGWEART